MADNFDFDVNSFLDTSYEAASSTERLFLPNDWRGIGLITDVELKQIVSKMTGEKFLMLDLTVELKGPSVEEHIKRPSLKIRKGLVLDVKPGAPGMSPVLDMSEGMNAELGKVRKALGQNTPGVAWTPKMMKGQAIGVVHKLRITDDGNKFADVKEFYPAA